MLQHLNLKRKKGTRSHPRPRLPFPRRILGSALRIVWLSDALLPTSCRLQEVLTVLGTAPSAGLRPPLVARSPGGSCLSWARSSLPLGFWPLRVLGALLSSRIGPRDHNSPVPGAGRESQDRASQPFWLLPAWVGGVLSWEGLLPLALWAALSLLPITPRRGLWSLLSFLFRESGWPG